MTGVTRQGSLRAGALVLGLSGLWGCADPATVCSLDGSEWAGQAPLCTPEQRANDTHGACLAHTIRFRGCEYRRRQDDMVIETTA